MPDRLYRSRRERLIGGVAGGMAESLRIDPTIVRLAWVLLALGTNGLLVLVYFVLLFVIPEAPRDELEGATATPDARTSPAPVAAARNPRSSGGQTGALVAGVVLVLVGGFFLVRRFLPAIDLGASWPVIVVGLGIVLILAALRPRGRRE